MFPPVWLAGPQMIEQSAEVRRNAVEWSWYWQNKRRTAGNPRAVVPSAAVF
jgi:hypothetical protein